MKIMDYSKITLGELLSSENETIKRHAVGILKTLQKNPLKLKKCVNCGEEIIGGYMTNAGLFCKECWNQEELAPHSF